MRSQTLFALSLCALALIVAAGCAGSAPDANANAASSSTSTNGASQPASATGQANVPAAATNPAAGQPAAASASQNVAGVAKEIDACALLTSDDIKAVQGEVVKDTKLSEHNSPPLNVAQCFFTTATFNKSVSLEVTSGVSGGKGAREFWDKQFARAREEAGHGGKKNEREREREKKKKEAEPRAGGEEEEEGSQPVPVKGIGDEAYWAASNVNGTLYARKGDAFVRVSIGGTDNEATRLGKVKTLAQKALARL